VGGVEILATSFLNLVNGDWLRRPAAWIEAVVLIITGVFFSGVFLRVHPLGACALAAGAALAVMIAAVCLQYFSNYWFPWLVIAGGQIPCALAWRLAAPKLFAARGTDAETTADSGEAATAVRPGHARSAQAPAGGAAADLPEAPDYELFDPPFGQGAYGKVWLVRNAIGQWQALKAVYQARFGSNTDPYEREFRGIRRYKPISDKHPGLLRVDFVSRKKRAGYFYYVMELGDPVAAGWEANPATYRPRDLASARAQAEGRRLPEQMCVEIALELAEALDFLHRAGLTHRDIKPSNIIFVNGRPKLADVGLVSEIRPPNQESTWVGTPDYMPPPPEPPGTAQADIYALGMALYVISTGQDAAFYPEVSTTLVQRAGGADFIRINAIILKACQPDRAQRYRSAAEMADDLRQAKKAMTPNPVA